MTTKVHVLKTSTSYFDAVWSGEKTFEVRYDDRGYQRGHKVRLREFDATIPCETCPRNPGQPWHVSGDCEKYSGREILATIGHVMASTPQTGKSRPGFNGLGYVVFSLLDVAMVDRVDPTPRSSPLSEMVAALNYAMPPTSTPITPAEAARRMFGGGEQP